MGSSEKRVCDVSQTEGVESDRRSLRQAGPGLPVAWGESARLMLAVHLGEVRFSRVYRRTGPLSSR